MKNDVVIIGAGLAGLCCAKHLQKAGVDFVLIDAADGVGGRIRTDIVDGFRLDRGFQVFLTSYPEAGQMLDLEALRLNSFLPGALVRFNGQFHKMADPWRQPVSAVRSLFSPIGSLVDKMRVAGLRSRSLGGTLEELFSRPETTTLTMLRASGFSDSMIDRFFRPFLGGIFLDSALDTSSRMFDFVFRMFSLGSAALPAEGMEAIPKQLATGLPTEKIRLGTRAVSIEAGLVKLESGEELQATAVVVATDGPVASQLLHLDDVNRAGQGVTCLYFAADRAPRDEPLIVLNGDGKGPVNNLSVPTVVAPTYGSDGRSLVSATVLGIPSDLHSIAHQVRGQLVELFGADAGEWKHLRTYTIPYALPRQAPPALADAERSVRVRRGIYVCGDHRDNASINGAMVSGRRAAEAVLADQ